MEVTKFDCELLSNMKTVREVIWTTKLSLEKKIFDEVCEGITELKIKMS